jgi:hypothetical protein
MELQLLQQMQDAGVPAWAGVLIWLAMKFKDAVKTEIHGFREDLKRHIDQTDKRLERLERSKIE